MTPTARELLTDCILNQLRGWNPDENCDEYRSLVRHKEDWNNFSVVVSWMNDMGDLAFALVIIKDEVIKEVQKAIMATNERRLAELLKKVQKFAVFRAARQDKGGSCLWEISAQRLEETDF